MSDVESEWYYKKPTRAVPLTDTFIRACFKTGAITPPLGSMSRTERASAIAIILTVFGALGLFALVLFFSALMGR